MKYRLGCVCDSVCFSVCTTGRVSLSAGSCDLVAVFVNTPALPGAAVTLSGLEIPVLGTAWHIRPYRHTHRITSHFMQDY